MHNSKEMSRSVWTSDGKYLIMAHAKFSSARSVSGAQIAKAVVHVYEGDPVVMKKAAIFEAYSKLHSYDLLDELQNAERMGRDYVDSIK
jgi:hypothetical protein